MFLPHIYLSSSTSATTLTSTSAPSTSNATVVTSPRRTNRADRPLLSRSNYEEIEEGKSKADSMLRDEMENQEIPSDLSKEDMVETNFFYSPIKGNISNSFNPRKGHFGIDVVAPKNSAVKSTLGGVVIFGNSTTDDGNVIIIYHGGDLISVYKHNSKLLKKVGDKVKSGDPVAIIGNTGEHTDGTHLHFELWQNGNALDPQKLISFE